ncbi:MAG: hypothetical protein IT368_04315 [Candidatus Hydrogenedentes bacterium]|nr:hypothetical protein [Candidatus Hydrogenedentota bacterium]
MDSVKWAGIEYNAYVLCRLCFGIALIGTWRKLPSHVGVYGIAPILIALITLFIRQDHFAPMLGHFYIGMIELCGSLYLAGLFLWNVGWGKRPAMEQKDDIPGSPARAIFSP